MVEGARPRHIREIGHLYLSTRGRERGAASLLVMAAPSRECFLAMHASNIAAALALRRFSSLFTPKVAIIDLGDTLPNTGYYLGLPPTRYLAGDVASSDRAEVGFLGIDVFFSMEAASESGRMLSNNRLGVVVLPELERFGSAEEMLRRAGECAADAKALLYCFGSEEQYALLDDLVSVSGWEHPVYLLSLDCSCKGIGCGDGFAPIGKLSGWPRWLYHRLPVVLREPSSITAASYMSACESLLFKMGRERRHRLAPAIGRNEDDRTSR